MNRVLIPALFLFLQLTGLLGAEDWTQFRGPHGDGHSAAKNLPTSWGGFETPAWQTNIPGLGWSSPIVIGEKIWLTTSEQVALSAEERIEKFADSPFGEQDFQADATVTLWALELDSATGRILRRIELFTDDSPAPIHAQNSYASPTPVTDGERIYCHFGSLGTVCLSLQSGKVIWKQKFVVQDITGPGSSPVLAGDKLIFPCDGADEQFVVALDKLTGAIVWRVPRPKMDAADGKLHRAFSTPLLISHDGKEQLIIPGAQWVVSYNPASGEESWRADFGDGHATVPRPVYRDGVVYICTGFTKPQLWAIRVDGSGDVSSTHVVWTYNQQVPEIPSPIVVGKEIYFVSSKGVATCLDSESGELVWQHRLGGNFAASPLAADGKLFFTSQEGVTTVLVPGREYREISRNQLFGQTMASLAVAGESILIRTSSKLYCVRKPSAQNATSTELGKKQ